MFAIGELIHGKIDGRWGAFRIKGITYQQDGDIVRTLLEIRDQSGFSLIVRSDEFDYVSPYSSQSIGVSLDDTINALEDLALKLNGWDYNLKLKCERLVLEFQEMRRREPWLFPTKKEEGE